MDAPVEFEGYDFFGRSFAMKLPKSWWSRSVVSAGPEMFVKDHPCFDLRRRFVPGEGSSVDAIREMALGCLHELRNTLPDFGLLEVWQVEIGQRNAFELSYLFNPKEVIICSRHIVCSVKNELYEIVLSAPDDQFSANTPLFDQIVSSVNWHSLPGQSFLQGEDAKRWLLLKQQQGRLDRTPADPKYTTVPPAATEITALHYRTCEYLSASQRLPERRSITQLDSYPAETWASVVNNPVWGPGDEGGLAFEERFTQPPPQPGESAVDPATGVYRPIDEFLGIEGEKALSPYATPADRGSPLTESELQERIDQSEDPLDIARQMAEGILPPEPKKEVPPPDPSLIALTEIGIGLVLPDKWVLERTTPERAVLKKDAIKIEIKRENINGYAVPIYAQKLLKTIEEDDSLTLIDSAQSGYIDKRPAFALDLKRRIAGTLKEEVQRHLIIGTDYLLYFVMRCDARAFFEGEEALQQVIQKAVWYPLEEMNTTVEEQWMDIDLGKGWTHPAQCIYMQHGTTSNVIFLKAAEAPESLLNDTGRQLLDAALNRPDIIAVNGVFGDDCGFRGAEGFRYAVDLTREDLKPLCLRGALFCHDNMMYILQLQSIAAADVADPLYTKLLKSVRLDSLTPAERLRMVELEQKRVFKPILNMKDDHE